MDTGQSFVANPQAAEPMQPGDGARDNPPGLTQATAVFASAPSNLRVDSLSQQHSPMRLRVVGTIGLHQCGLSLRAARFAAEWQGLPEPEAATG